MNSETEQHGSCLCGKVTVSARFDSNNVGVCHCNMCRTWGGGPLLAVESKHDVNIEGGDQVSVFASSEWAERGFCKTCGTHVFYRLKKDAHYAFPVGLFGDATQWKLAEQIFIEQKPAFYSFAQKTRELTGKEAFAQGT